MSKSKPFTGNRLMAKICEAIAIYEPFSSNDILELYLEVGPVDKVLATIEVAKESHTTLAEAKNKSEFRSSNVKKPEIKDVDKTFKKKWLKKGQKGIGIRNIRFRFGKN